MKSGAFRRCAAALFIIGVCAALMPAMGVAAPALGDPCPNGDLRQPQGTSFLPDCMALEQVSPQAKDLQSAKVFKVDDSAFGHIFRGAISIDGERVSFASKGALADTPVLLNVFGDTYVATRSGDGWVTSPTNLPGLIQGWNREASARSFDSNLGSWFTVASADHRQASEGLASLYRASLGTGAIPFSPLLAPVNLASLGDPLLVVDFTKDRGASADQSHFYVTPGPEGGIAAAYGPFDPRPSGSGAARNTYVASLDSMGRPVLALLARDGDGVVWGGNCGASVGGNADLPRNVGAISADGSRTLFTTRPAQPFDEGTSIGPTCSSANKARIMLRHETLGGVEIDELFQSECDRVADPGPPVVPACGQTPAGQVVPDGDDTFQGASIEGTRVYFTTSRQLADSDVNGFDALGIGSGCAGGLFGPGGCDLYVYDETKAPGERLTQVTAGSSGQTVPSVAVISGDGSHAYFNSTEVLTTEPGPGNAVAQPGQNNLYAYDAVAGELAFVAIASPSSPYPVPVLGPDPAVLGVGGDGHLLFFTSTAALTADDLDGSHADVFRYDAEEESLVRISRAAPGGVDNGPEGVQVGVTLGQPGLTFNEGGVQPDYVVRGRWVSEDGQTVAFVTAEGLGSGDVNGVADDYLWRDGELYRFPGTADRFGKLVDRPVVSVDGDTVAFQSFEQLLPRDADTAADVYVARVEGGFPEPITTVCAPDGDGGCQGAAGAAPAAPAAASASQIGRGNLVEPASRRPCRKGKRRVRRNGKVRCVAKRSAGKRKERAAGSRSIRAMNTKGRAGK